MSEREAERPVAVVGAGIAGLAAALALRARGVAVRVIEPRGRAGGVIETVAADGFLFERGPNAFQVKPPALGFLRGEGLADGLLRAGPEARTRYLFHDGALEPVPDGPRAALRSPLVSGRGKLRMLAEPFAPRGDGRAETVAEFTRRRLGDEAYRRLVAPFLVGVYAGDAAQLGAAAVFPALVGYEERAGSILAGALGSALDRKRPRGLPGSYSTRAGLGALCDALAARLGDALWLRSRVRALEPAGTGWRLALEGEGAPATSLLARAVVLATGAPGARALLAAHDREAGELLAGIAYAPMLSVPLELDPTALPRPLRGFGFLVPPDADVDLLGGLFMSRVFPGRAPPGRELVMAMIGGQRWPEAIEAADDSVLERVATGLARTLGYRRELRPLEITRWPQAIPQPGRDHGARIAALRGRVAALPGLALAGAYLDGVSVADALASGLRAARSLSPASGA